MMDSFLLLRPIIACPIAMDPPIAPIANATFWNVLVRKLRRGGVFNGLLFNASIALCRRLVNILDVRGFEAVRRISFDTNEFDDDETSVFKLTDDIDDNDVDAKFLFKFEVEAHDSIGDKSKFSGCHTGDNMMFK